MSFPRISKTFSGSDNPIQALSVGRLNARVYPLFEKMDNIGEGFAELEGRRVIMCFATAFATHCMTVNVGTKNMSAIKSGDV